MSSSFVVILLSYGFVCSISQGIESLEDPTSSDSVLTAGTDGFALGTETGFWGAGLAAAAVLGVGTADALTVVAIGLGGVATDI